MSAGSLRDNRHYAADGSPLRWLRPDSSSRRSPRRSPRWMTFTPTGPGGPRWSTTPDRRDRRLARAAARYAYLLIPALFVLFAVLFVSRIPPIPEGGMGVRRRGAAANLTVQFVKIAPLGIEESSTALNPLSGHVGVAAGVCLGWLVVAPTPWRRRSAAAAAMILVAVSTGVMAAGWHSPFQVLCPLLMATGWAVVGAALLSREDSGRGARRCTRDVRHGVAATLSGLAGRRRNDRTSASGPGRRSRSSARPPSFSPRSGPRDGVPRPWARDPGVAARRGVVQPGRRWGRPAL